MTAEEIRLAVEPPEVQAVPRVVEVACGDSYVTVKQLDGRRGLKWSVYSNDGAGMNGPIQESPNGATLEAVLPWAHERVRLMERERLSFAALRRHLGKGMPATESSST